MDFCVYLITYLGDKLPPKRTGEITPYLYLGSTLVKNIEENGYRGSVRSKKYMKIWKDEIKINPHLFSTQILSYHKTKQDAEIEEKRLQLLYKVVKSPEYINLSVAQPNGFYGKPMNGDNHWAFGKTKDSDERLALKALNQSGENHWTYSGYSEEIHKDVMALHDENHPFETISKSLSIRVEDIKKIIKLETIYRKTSEKQRKKNRYNNTVWAKYSQSKQLLTVEQRHQLIQMKDGGMSNKDIWEYFNSIDIKIKYPTISNIYHREKLRLNEKEYEIFK